MKFKQISVALLCALFISTAGFSQRRSNYSESDAPEQAFTVGIAPISLLTGFGKFNVRGEWAYANNKSLSLLVAIPRRTNIPNYFSSDVSVVSGKSITNRFTNLGFTLENRFYIGSDEPRGFYLAPYARYNRYDITREIEKTSNGSTTKIEGALGGVGVGGAAGVQFRMGRFMTMDITFIGLDLKWMRGTFRYQTNDPETDIVAFRDQVQASLKGIPIIGNQLAAAIDGDHIKVHSPGFALPGYRFNMTVNYAF
ncbi:MAG: hypothetical protein WCR52_24485 [Bacteroidota bacterium]